MPHSPIDTPVRRTSSNRLRRSPGGAPTWTALVGLLVVLGPLATLSSADSFVRYRHGGQSHYGEQVGSTLHQLDAAPWSGGTRTGESVSMDEVELQNTVRQER